MAARSRRSTPDLKKPSSRQELTKATLSSKTTLNFIQDSEVRSHSYEASFACYAQEIKQLGTASRLERTNGTEKFVLRKARGLRAIARAAPSSNLAEEAPVGRQKSQGGVES